MRSSSSSAARRVRQRRVHQPTAQPRLGLRAARRQDRDQARPAAARAGPVGRAGGRAGTGRGSRESYRLQIRPPVGAPRRHRPQPHRRPQRHGRLGDPVAKWIDCNDLFVDAPVSDAALPLIPLGSRADVILEGEGHWRVHTSPVARRRRDPGRCRPRRRRQGPPPGDGQVLLKLEASRRPSPLPGRPGGLRALPERRRARRAAGPPGRCADGRLGSHRRLTAEQRGRERALIQVRLARAAMVGLLLLVGTLGGLADLRRRGHARQAGRPDRTGLAVCDAPAAPRHADRLRLRHRQDRAALQPAIACGLWQRHCGSPTTRSSWRCRRTATATPLGLTLAAVSRRAQCLHQLHRLGRGPARRARPAVGHHGRPAHSAPDEAAVLVWCRLP